MRLPSWRVYLGVALLVAAAAAAGLRLYSQARRPATIAMPAAECFRLVFGAGDREPGVWDGRVGLSSGSVISIQGWRFAGNDSSDYKATWKASTRYGPAAAAAARKKGKDARGPMQDNGVLIAASLTDPDTTFTLETRQGNFSFKASEVAWGQTRSLLDGRVEVDRVPYTLQLTTSDEEQDYPAAAQTADDLYVAYVEFVHGDRSQVVQGQFKEAPKNFAFLARPAGGDQVKLVRYSKSRRRWSPPEEVTGAGQDIMRAAVAVDGSKRVWVIWSANRDGNFDLYAKNFARGQWSSEMRLTSDPGPDLNPVAAADAGGRVWIAWQGFRKGNLEVFALTLDGGKPTPETLVSASPASDWDPAIAAAPNGEIAIAWDTYDKGDYDVWFRRARFEAGVKLEAPVPVAASANFEARPSIAYDSQNRLWVAYEASAVRWGKDFGAYETTGVALYQGHTVKVHCFDGPRVFATGAELDQALPGPFAMQRRARRAEAAAGLGPQWPNPEAAAKRPPSATPQPPPLPRNSFPRIGVDPGGTVYLAFRSSGGGRSPAGTVWVGQLVYLQGEKWSRPIAVPHSDTLLDSRPALAGIAPGQLMMLTTSDHRQAVTVGGARRGGSAINADIYAAEFRVSPAETVANLPPASPATLASTEPEFTAEAAQIRRMREARATAGGQTLRLLRGEFHRHTEMSGDGGNDGPLIDAYRYMIDAAGMDWGGCCDHDNGGGREYFWWTQQKLTDAYKMGERFIPMFSYERSVRYPEGHRNTVFVKRGIRPLPRLPLTAEDSPPTPAPDTQMLYRYLREFDGVVASHTSGTGMGTDWRDNDPILEPVVEIYQGDRQNYEMPGAPRANSEKDSIGAWRPLGFVSLALQKGYRLGFQASSDHISTHMSYCNLWVTAPTREAIREAFHKRRVYGATDNILADVRCGAHFMGEEFSVSEPPVISVKLEGLAAFAKVHIIKDGQYAYSVEPKQRTVEFTWRDNAAVKGKTSYYYVRGEQTDGELVWVSPMWIKWGQ
ncbi:MAG: hypothetical protein Q8N47_28270 [Bryobacterales bacterium]|nr:hypothetical protein [Bryobacterales bacterium]